MRLIDADELKTTASIQRANFNTIETIRRWIDEAPTVDAVPVVRCKDCEYWKVETEQCDLFDADDYCSCGKMKAEP